VLDLVLELVEGLAGTEDSVDGGEDESEAEGTELVGDEVSEVEDGEDDESSTGVATKLHVAVKLHARRHDDGSNDGADGKDVAKQEGGSVVGKNRNDENCKDKNRGVVDDVGGQVDPQTVECLTDALGKPVLGIQVILLHLIEIHCCKNLHTLKKGIPFFNEIPEIIEY